MKIEFSKFQGTGNDFVILDNWNGKYAKLSKEQIRKVCDRRFGIGGDGLMLLNLKEGYDFAMQYYNADGKESTMCGNGGRCLVKFAYQQGLHKDNYLFLAADGPHEAEIDLNGWVRLRMKDVDGVEVLADHSLLNTGSPHFVKFVPDVKGRDVREEGREIRYSKSFAQDGINVNFVENLDDHTIYVRTYERGVEDETFSCGTGVTAAALMAFHNEIGFNQVDVQTLGGKLSVEYARDDDVHYRNIWLVGPAEFVFKGEMDV